MHEITLIKQGLFNKAFKEIFSFSEKGLEFLTFDFCIYF